VPHINAASLEDAMFLQGFVTAQDRMWQMDALRRLASGELAEVLGKAAARIG
jgi:penicillin amidase